MQTDQAISMYLEIHIHTHTYIHTCTHKYNKERNEVINWKENSGWAYMEGFRRRKNIILKNKTINVYSQN